MESYSNEKKQKTIEKRQGALKQEVLMRLREAPIVEYACRRAGVSRATFYRWQNTSKKFKEESEKALSDGRLLLNDLGETKLIEKMKEGNFPAIRFWLSNNHSVYKTQRKFLQEKEPESEKKRKVLNSIWAIIRSLNKEGKKKEKRGSGLR